MNFITRLALTNTPDTVIRTLQHVLDPQNIGELQLAAVYDYMDALPWSLDAFTETSLEYSLGACVISIAVIWWESSYVQIVTGTTDIVYRTIYGHEDDWYKRFTETVEDITTKAFQ